MEYFLILALTLLVSPFVLTLLLGFLNWEKFTTTGRSGFDLALAFPQTFLWVFFLILFLQAVFLTSRHPSLGNLTVVLNFVNTVIFFVSQITLGSVAGKQLVSWGSILAAFLILVANIVGLIYINKDKNMLAKFPYA